MAGGHNHHEHRDLQRKECDDCRRIYEKNKHTDFAWFCDQHLCPIVRLGVPCNIRKSKHQARCDEHAIPPPPPPKCNVDGCQLVRLDRSLHCHLHSCTFANCPMYARPGKGVDYCDEHKCPESSCRAIRKRSELGETLRWAAFCRDHECERPGCLMKRLPGKSHCQAHCCNMQHCQEGRLDNLPAPFCLSHYNYFVGQRAAAQREAELQAELQAQKLREAEQREIQQREDAELARKLEQADRKAQTEAEAEAQAQARLLRTQQEALVREQEAEERRREEDNQEVEEQWQAERARAAAVETARAMKAQQQQQQSDEEARAREEERGRRIFTGRGSGRGGAKYKTQRQWEKSPRASSEQDFHDMYRSDPDASVNADLKARMGRRFEKPGRPVASGYHGENSDSCAQPRDRRDERPYLYDDSSRSSTGSYYEVPHVSTSSRLRRGAQHEQEQPVLWSWAADKSGEEYELKKRQRERKNRDDYVYVHNHHHGDDEDDEAYHSATEYLRPGRAAASSSAALVGVRMEREKEYVTADGTTRYYNERGSERKDPGW
ncbi:uncharacterized protein L3040_001780 [Drepanopeziza brunnea f. sp. 'multigermtubi']|uniref:uncharacterized protein n=1 Tax=Drepanopeziza brunnea f. sp. 'multigermtubi' TaxID=698441 RepID=UPI00239E494A|nr:hypothetical protein L3040_001780 [Drepanopeziza brunnea f. sp. 'multigermtubi']